MAHMGIGALRWAGLSKLVEEAGELNQVIGKLQATEGQALYFDGSDLRAELLKELADVHAAWSYTLAQNFTPAEVGQIHDRVRTKLKLYEGWHHKERARLKGLAESQSTISDALFVELKRLKVQWWNMPKGSLLSDIIERVMQLTGLH